jgi:TetR/AcrR family transcriptional regulator
MKEEPGRRESILAAAFAEFAAKGFRGATIKSIAGAAGVQSPALLYWYFPSKDALFQAVLEAHAPILGAVAELAPLVDEPPEVVLGHLGGAYLTMAQGEQERRFFRLLLMEAIQRPEVAQLFLERGPVRVLGFLADYLTRQIALGRLRPHDVRASARAFFGMLIPQLLLATAFSGYSPDGLTDEEHLNATIAIFLRGLQPETNDER